jgi:uncharacterized protein (UPF0264 family)
MKVMSLPIVDGCLMALEAQRISRFDGLHAVNIVAVAAADLPVVHLALGEGTIDVDLIENLSVRKVEPLSQEAGQHGVQKVVFGMGVVSEDGPS